MRRLLDAYPRLVAVRDAGGEPGYLRELAALCRGRAEVHTGGVRNLLTALHHGSQGFLSSEANLAPALAVAVVKAFEARDFVALHEMHGHLFRLHEFVNRFGGSAGRGMKPLPAISVCPGACCAHRGKRWRAASASRCVRRMSRWNCPERR